MTSTHTQEWRDIKSAPLDTPVLVTWVNSYGNPVVGEAWLTIMSWEVECEIADWTRVNRPVFCWSIDPDGETVLEDEPTHWMPLPEPPQTKEITDAKS